MLRYGILAASRRDAEAEMLDGERAVVVDEVERQAVVDVHGRERSDAALRPPDAEDIGESPRRGTLVSRGHDHVIELDRHRSQCFLTFPAPHTRLVLYEKKL